MLDQPDAKPIPGTEGGSRPSFSPDGQWLVYFTGYTAGAEESWKVGALWMPAPQSGSPMTYMLDGKQYIVVAVSGGNYTGEYLAFKLPD
jgi:Tol biopolymer transport system component